VSKTAGAALTVVGHVIRGYSPATVVSVVREQVCLNACPPPHTRVYIYIFIYISTHIFLITHTHTHTHTS
jgi:hypothetical protein